MTALLNAAFEKVSIVPSISIACITLPVTIMRASAVWPLRQFRNPIRRRIRANPPEAKPAHIATTPQTENTVGEDKSNASITSGGLVTQRPPTCRTTLTSKAAPTTRCRRRAEPRDMPGKNPDISSGWTSKSAKAIMPANPPRM